MLSLLVKVNREKVPIDKITFTELLDLSAVKELAAYRHAIENGTISLQDLKELAIKAGVPYPLFFAPRKVVKAQLDDKDKNLYSKIPGKDEIKLSSRGGIKIAEIELILRDLSRKQDFLKTRVLPNEAVNSFVGCVAKMVQDRTSNKDIADKIRDWLEIDLTYLRSISKSKVVNYLCYKAETKGIFISFSSYNFMPQNIDRDTGLSGICIKDKKFPFVFVNTRDGDENPKILESAGRQIFTLMAMLVCVAMNRFILSSKVDKKDEGKHKQVFTIAGEVLVPSSDIQNIRPMTLDELKGFAQEFKVTPSMLLMRLVEAKRIEEGIANQFRALLSAEVKRSEPKQKHAPLQTTGYAKYNGERFSREVINAFRKNAVTQDEVKNVLFRRGKMEPGLLQEYAKRFS